MKQIAGNDGMFEMNDEMPAGPNDFAVPPYMLPNTYGRAEQEEAAARIITACQEAGCWCGVSMVRLMDTMRAEHETFYSFMDARDRFDDDERNYGRKRVLYFFLVALTLGLYALIGKKPVRPQPPVQPKVPFTGIYMFGPRHVMTGLVELKDKGMLRVETTDDFDVVFPTPKLLEPITQFRRDNIQ